MKKIASLLTLLIMCLGAAFAQNEPMHGWHTYCTSEFAEAISYGTHTTVAICYPPDMASNFAGTQITKVAMFSDGPTNSIGGIYTCSIYLGGETPSEGLIAYTMSCDVPQGLNDWAEFDLSTPIWVTGDETIWIVWQAEQPLSPWHMGVCSDIDPSGNGIWAWNGTQWDQIWFSTGDWTVKTYFNWDNPQSQFQDVYFAGSSNGVGKIWKNDSLIYSISDTIPVNLSSMLVTEDGTVYTAGHLSDSTHSQGFIWQGDDILFAAGDSTHIYDFNLNDDGWTAVGDDNNEWGIAKGLVWQNGEVLYSYSDSISPKYLYALCIDTIAGDIYSGGTSDSIELATVWKNDTVLWQAEFTSSVCDMLHDGTDLYTCGYYYLEGLLFATAWQNDSIIFSINDLTLSSSFQSIAMYDGDLYLAGYVDDTIKVWKNGETLYYHVADETAWVSDLCVNEYGVYYAGQVDGAGTVWKDGEILYQPEGCEVITALTVMPIEPTPVYTITVESDNLDWGTVSGGGEYALNDTATIEATPNIGYEFLMWNDSITDNPRDIVVTQDSTFVAFFGQLEYLIQTEVNPVGSGTVTGGGVAHYGDTLTLVATAEPGYGFVSWGDGNPSNPRDIVVTQDSTFVALFVLQQYTITVESSNPEWGSVSGGGTYYYGDTIEIAATPTLGHVFMCWDDGNMDNPREVIVTEDHTYIGHFDLQQYAIATVVTPEGAGTVTGGGIYYYGDTITLTAQNNTGYDFFQWDDGVTDNPRTVIVEGDATYTAVFNLLQYEITTAANPAEGGTVTGGGIYDYGSTATLTATPNEGYIFICWNDGGGSNPRHVTVTGDASYTALFRQHDTPTYTITVLTNNPLLGDVTGSGEYPEGGTIEISASPSPQAYFKCWDDSNTDNPRSIVVTQDMTFTAFFEVISQTYYDITVVSNDPLMGRVTGGGSFPVNTTTTIEAIPYQGFHFVGWQDGNTNNPREILIIADTTYTAYFDVAPVQTYTVTVQYDEDQGYVLGGGSYVAGSIATLAAIANDNYVFVKWGDGVTDNPREILVDHDITLSAFFNGTGVDEYDGRIVRLYPNPANDIIHIEGLEGECEMSIYNAFGMCVKTLTLNGSSEITVGDLAAGLYLMRINGRQTVKFMKR